MRTLIVSLIILSSVGQAKSIEPLNMKFHEVGLFSVVQEMTGQATIQKTFCATKDSDKKMALETGSLETEGTCKHTVKVDTQTLWVMESICSEEGITMISHSEMKVVKPDKLITKMRMNVDGKEISRLDQVTTYSGPCKDKN